MWTVFFIILSIIFLYDIFFYPKDATLKYNVTISIIYIIIALIFGLFTNSKTEYFTAYLVEKTLSLDNVFVFSMIFSKLKIEAKYQHRVLFWGILSVIIFRAIMLYAGIQIINKFHWVLYVFGVILIYSGIKMLKADTHNDNLVEKLKKYFPITEEYHNGHFIINSKLTSLGLSLIAIEFFDILFAIDSIPAVLAVSNDMFIIYTSNIFAILGLRSLYSCLESLMQLFKYLKQAISILLIYVGVKILINELFFKIPSVFSLIVIFGIITGGILLSIRKKNA